jgi:uncharacterized protein (TIGR02594 family)
MHEILGYRTLAAGVDLHRCPWMEFALQKFRTQQPAQPTTRSDVFGFLDTVKDSSKPKLPHVQHWTDHQCTNWCSGFVNWCLGQAAYQGTRDALALSWLRWGERSQPRWGAIAVVTAPIHHVGFYVMQKNGHVYILGGNQRDHDHQGGVNSVNISGHFGAGCRIEYRMPVPASVNGNRSVLASA